MSTNYYPIYKTTNMQGVSKLIALEAFGSQSELPASVEYEGNIYTLDKTFIVNTPSLEDAFVSYCRSHQIEMDIPH